jgi:predicted dehydrogenase
MKSTTIRWGILGTGRISRLFTSALNYCAEHDVTDHPVTVSAVGSRTKESADNFAAEYSIPHAYGSYEELAAAPDVDIIFVGTPNPFHYENAKLALEAGKGVLCEKPFMLNAAEAAELIAYARAKGLFFCEAMWTRFFPAADKIREWLADRVIGDIRLVTANFGFNARVTNDSRLFNLGLGGGALLDVGTYDIAFATMVYGPDAPRSIAASAYFADTGVDAVTSVTLGYGSGLASLNCGVVASLRNNAVIYGSGGVIEIPDSFWSPHTVLLNAGRDRHEVFECKYEFNGYEYEVREMARCFAAGLTDSPLMTLADSLNTMKIMDESRRQIGLVYPNEKI